MRTYDKDILKSNRELNKKANRTRCNWGKKISKKQKRKARLLKKREKRKYKRIPKQYKVYIVSKHWTERKNRYYRKHARKCVICYSTKYIALHHMVYKNYGDESDHSLIPLCREHHTDFHANYQMKSNIKRQTLEYILEKREGIGREPINAHLQKKFNELLKE